MKKFIYILIAIVILALIGIVLSGLGGTDSTPASEPSEETTKEENQTSAQIPEGEAFEVAVQESEVLWEGRKILIDGYRDTGSIGIKEGYFTTEEEAVLGGKIVFDMDSIKVFNTGLNTGTDNLEKHLKSPDWFSVEDYPTAELTISEVKPGTVSGEVTLLGTLTIKDVTKNVSIPASVSWDNETLTVSGKTDLDRTLWDIKYGSGKFFDDLADQVIDDFFGIEFRAVARTI